MTSLPAAGLGAQMGLELGEDHFDWIEIWTIGRQEQDPCAPGANGLVSGRAFMGRQVVHDDDVARLRLGRHGRRIHAGAVGSVRRVPRSSSISEC
jgi:hypothetical protein